MLHAAASFVVLGAGETASQLRTPSMAAHSCPRNPILLIHFFTIILKTNLERLKIPTKFTRRYGGGLSNPMLVKPPDGTEWKVYWTEHNGEFWFEKGWREFTKKYFLDHGHLVLFKYKGTSQFDVLILDRSAIEIEYPFPSSDTCDDLIEILDEIPSNQKARPKSALFSPRPRKIRRNGTRRDGKRSSNLQNLHVQVRNKGNQSQGTKFQKSVKQKLKGVKATQRTLSLNRPRSARAREIAENFITKNHYFTLPIKPGNLSVPNFTDDIETKEHDVKLQLGERSWPVKYICYLKRSHGFLSAGWSSFLRGSKLKPGDICVFEVIKREDPVPVLKVHVY